MTVDTAGTNKIEGMDWDMER